MPLPAGVETVTVSSGEPLTLPDGTLMRGRLLFTGPDVVTISGEDVVLGGTVEAALADGEFSVELVATDAAGMSPSGWTYKVTAVMANAPNWVRYLSLPAASPSVTLAAVLVPDPVAGEFSTLVSLDGVTAADIGAVPEGREITAGAGLTGGGALDEDRELAVDFGTSSGTVCEGDDGRLSDPRTPTAHAASHAEGGSDPVTLTQDQITGLTAALAALLPLTGGILTGGLTMDGANLTVQREDGTGGYQFRVTGGGLNLDIGALDVFISRFANADFTGAETYMMRWEAAGPHLIGRVQFGTGPFDNVHDIDSGTGIAALGAKNGLANVRLAGFKDSAGAPTTGTWTAGDVVLDSAGAWHLCTAGGEPGTWT